MSGTRAAIAFGAVPIIVGLIYLILWVSSDIEEVIDPAGVVLLVCLGLAMGFGMMVILRGARDL